MPDLLIVEDDHYAAAALSDHLGRAGYTTRVVHLGSAAISSFSDGPVDLVLLDLVLPDTSGFDVLEFIRETGSTPVIVMSALTDKSHQLNAYRRGADDFLVKPFGIAELIVHIEARLNPHIAQRSDAYPLKIVRADRSVTFHGTPIRLTNREFDVLVALNQNPGVLLSRDDLLRIVWATSAGLKTRTVHQHITNLMGKLRGAGVNDAIRTVRGRGWVWTLPHCVIQQGSMDLSSVLRNPAP